MKKMNRVVAAVVLAVIICGLAWVSPEKAQAEQKDFELPLNGATGYGVVDLVMRSGDTNQSEAIGTLPAGQPFTILEEGNKYLKCRTVNGTIFWAYKAYTLVNLPDVVPSVVYKATNAYGSLFRSSGKSLSGITGESLYTGKTWNARLGMEEYNMPVLFSMARKIAAAQAAALAEGNTLVLYEGYRPASTQTLVKNGLSNLAATDRDVNAGITKSPWNKSWFISQGTSNHQRGGAIDVSLAKVEETEENEKAGYLRVTKYTEYEMPTQMHELSYRAATFTTPISSWDSEGWKKLSNPSNFTDGARLLQKYCTNAGMTPLASEWWHFNDNESLSASKKAGKGGFSIEGNLSIVPQN